MATYRVLKSIPVFIAVATVYFLLALPYISFNYTDGFSQVRLSGLIPLAAGLLFGPVGAFACAFGNLIRDLLDGFNIFCIFGFFGNFLMAYLPYKMWHIVAIYRNRGPRFLDSASSVVIIVTIIFISNSIAAGTIAAGGELLNGFKFFNFFVPVAIQNDGLSIMGSMLIFQICTQILKIKPHIPVDAYKYHFDSKHYIPDIILLSLSVFIIFALLGVSLFLKANEKLVTDILCSFFIICVVLFSILPIKRSKTLPVVPAPYREVMGIRAQIITLFLTIISILLFFFTIVVIRMIFNDFKLTGLLKDYLPYLWIRVILTVTIAANAIMFLFAFLLKILQKKIVEPIDTIATYTVEFAGQNELRQDVLIIKPVGNELDQLGDAVNIMAGDIRKYVLDIKERIIAEEKLNAQLRVAKAIQENMLPEPWGGEGFDLEPFIKPAKEVGGDFYHFDKLDEDRVLICIADVSGKDISAAMFMIRTKTIIDTYRHLTPGKLFTKVNNTLSTNNKTFMFVTAFAGILDKKNMTFTYANAGHNPPIYYDRGSVKWLDGQHDMILGPVENIQYEEHTISVTKDFRILLYTDGVTEAINQGGELFGEDRLFSAVSSYTAQRMPTSSEFLELIVNRIADFSKGAPQSDDITMIALSIK